jgi:hypothetical protein
MMILADAEEGPLWMRIVLPIVPWVVLAIFLWFAVWWQSRCTTRILREQMRSVEAILDRIARAIEKR